MGVIYITTYKDLKELIESGERVKTELLQALQDIRDYLEGQGKPKGYTTRTSYTDYDAIHGSRGEIHAEQLQKIIEEARHLESMLVLQESSLERYYKMKKEIDDCLEKVTDVTIKVSMLRAKGFTQEEVAELIEKSPRTIQRMEKKNREV